MHLTTLIVIGALHAIFFSVFAYADFFIFFFCTFTASA